MPQVTIRRPFGELDLGDQLRLDLEVTVKNFVTPTAKKRVSQSFGRDESQCG